MSRRRARRAARAANSCYEFAADPKAVRVTAINPQGEHRAWTLDELLPAGFSGRELPGAVSELVFRGGTILTIDPAAIM